MRTKNGKRIGPVPIAVVAVFALAALLSAGLFLAPNGTPTAEAQDADCEISLNTAGDSLTLPTGETCSVLGETATVVIEGANDATEDHTLTLLIADANGPITAYPNGTTWSGANTRLEDADGAAVSSMRYRYQSVEIKEAAPNPTTGIIEGQKVTLMVQGDIHFWTESTSVTSLITGIPEGNPASGAREVSTGSDDLNIVFFGAPAVGKDSDKDRNNIVDDFQQCTIGPDATDAASTDPDGNMANCNASGDDVLDAEDIAESRSTLMADNEGTFAAAEDGTTVLDGKKATLTLTTQSSAAIRATIKDSENQILDDVEVTFVATSSPEGIENRTRSYDTSEEGIAEHTISGLPTSGAYRVTVKVTAGKDNPVPIGQIIIARAGKLETLTANACTMLASGKTDTNMMDGCMDNYDPKMQYGTGDDVTIHAATSDAHSTPVSTARVVVKPGTAMYWWNSLDCMEMNDAVMPMGDEPAVGPDDASSSYCKMYDVLEAGAKKAVNRAFGESYGDVTKALDITATGKPVTAGAAMFTVKDNAPGGRYLLFVEAKDGVGNDEVVRTKLLGIAVADKLASYMIEGPAYIALDGSGMFTVSAMDKNGLPPIFNTEGDDRNDRVTVLVQPNTALVAGLNTMGQLQLKNSDGMGTFTVYAPLEAMQGQRGRIIIGSGEMQKIHSFTFGMAPDPMTVPGKPMNVEATADGHDTIDVSWDAPDMDGNSPITGYIIERRYDGDMMGDIPSDGYNTAAGGASFAFSDHMEWWETLNCKGMLAAAGSDADHTMDSDDKTMYCAHYDMTEPTNMAGTITTGDTTDMKIKALFDKRYIMDYRTDDTATMHSDTGLMAETEYTYRVSAVNAEGRSMWSDVAMTTTAVGDLGAPSITRVDAGVSRATITITPGENADKHFVWAEPVGGRSDSNPGAYSSRAAGDATTVTITGLVSGASYWFTAVAGRDNDGTGEWSDWSGWTAATPIQ